jgi:hypothetical protein
MRAIRSAALSGCVLLALALVVVGAASATGAPGKPAASGDNAKARHAAEASCRAKGLKPGTDAFKACVKIKLAPAKTPGGDSGGSAQPAPAPKSDAPGSDSSAPPAPISPAPGADSSAPPAPKPPAPPAPNPDRVKVQQAAQACEAQGLQPDTDAFKQCMHKALGQ